MVYSASYIYAKETFGSSGFYFYRQIVFNLIGVAICFAVSRTKIDFWIKYSTHLAWLCVAVLILTYIPGIGVTVKGANRWINILGLRFQPGEMAKYALILTSLDLFNNFHKHNLDKRIKMATPILLCLLIIAKQPDFGTFSICFLVMLFICYLSEFSRFYFYMLLSSGAVVSTILLFAQPYRIQRLLTYLDPWKNPKTSGFQIIQSYLAFANGAIFGQGLGNSNEKLFYLPEAHNDFIFSVIGEELGFIGVLLIIALFVYFIYTGFRMSLMIENKERSMIVVAIIFVLSLQTFLNMAVVLGLLPTKGLNLPFVSYGGSSLLNNYWGIGLLLAVVREQRQKYLETQTLSQRSAAFTFGRSGLQTP
jgi:cell division protein FtsW